MQALVKWSCSLSRTTSIAGKTSLGEGPLLKGPYTLTMTREHSGERVHGKEEHFCNFQSLGHRPIIVPKVQTATNPLRSAYRERKVPRTYIETCVVNHPSWRGWRVRD